MDLKQAFKNKTDEALKGSVKPRIKKYIRTIIKNFALYEVNCDPKELSAELFINDDGIGCNLWYKGKFYKQVDEDEILRQV